MTQRQVADWGDLVLRHTSYFTLGKLILTHRLSSHILISRDHIHLPLHKDTITRNIEIQRWSSANANSHFIPDGTVNLGYKVWPRRNSFLTNKSEKDSKKIRGTRCSAKQHAQNHECVIHSLAKLCLFLVHVIIIFSPWLAKLISSRGHVHPDEKWTRVAACGWRAWSAAAIPSLPSLEGLSSWPALRQPSGTPTPPHSRQCQTSAPVKQSGNTWLPWKYFKPAPGGGGLSCPAPIHNPITWTLHWCTQSIEEGKYKKANVEKGRTSVVCNHSRSSCPPAAPAAAVHQGH